PPQHDGRRTAPRPACRRSRRAPVLTGGPLRGCAALPIVRRPRDGIGEHRVGDGDLLEDGGGSWTRAIRVPPQGQAPPDAAKLGAIDVRLHAEENVVVLRGVACHPRRVSHRRPRARGSTRAMAASTGLTAPFPSASRAAWTFASNA